MEKANRDVDRSPDPTPLASRAIRKRESDPQEVARWTIYRSMLKRKEARRKKDLLDRLRSRPSWFGKIWRSVTGQ